MSSAEILAARLRALPGWLESTLERVESIDPWPGDPAGRRFVVTGGGLSEGPARFLAALLRQRLGTCADFVPQSEFARHDAPAFGDTLVLFSQGLAPNARLPLPHARAYRDATVFTSIPEDAEAARGGARLVVLPPRPGEEDGLLLRIAGTAVQCLAAAALVNRLAVRAGGADQSDELRRVPALYAAPVPGVSLVDGDRLAPVALIAAGRYAEYCFGLRWKLLEGLHLPDPPVWDVLQVAHGPLQSFFREHATLIALERADTPHEKPLFDRLAAVLAPERHRLVRVPARLPTPLCFFEHDAALDALVIDAVRRRAIDLADWPGKGRDLPLYEVSPETI